MHAHTRAVLAAALVLALAGADGGQDERPRLRDALLDAVDFPIGWASDSERAAERRGLGVPEPKQRRCREIFDAGGADRTVEAGFARTSTGPFVTTAVSDHGTARQARRAMDAFRKAAGECSTFHAEEGPEGRSVTVAYQVTERGDDLPDVGRLGDGSAAVRYHRKLQGEATTPVRVDVVLVRVDAHVVRVAQAGRDEPGTGSVASIAERAVEKLRQVTRGAMPSPEPDQPGTTDL